MDLNFKNESEPNGKYWVINSTFFAITDRNPWVTGICEEYDIVKKINDNEEGYFDFSKTLIDVGSEDGNYAMLTNFKRNYCFEPNKRMCCLIYANMYLKDKVSNTEVYNVALGEKDGDIAVFNGFAESGSGFYAASMNRCENGVEEITKRTLDSYCIRNVGLIKTDTEGFDYFVLLGGIHTIIENNYPPILFECWDVGTCGQTEETHDRLMNFLKMLGYEIIEHWGDHETHLAIKKK